MSAKIESLEKVVGKDLDYKAICVNPLTREPVKGPDEASVTLQHLLYECAVRPLSTDENMAIGEKMRLHSIAVKVAEMKVLKPSELIKLKNRGGKFLSILALGFIVKHIDAAVGEVTEETD